MPASARRRDRRPAGPPARHRRQPDHRPGPPLRRRGRLRRPGRRRPRRRRCDVRAGSPDRARSHLNCQFDEPAAARRPLDARRAGRRTGRARRERRGLSRPRRPATRPRCPARPAHGRGRRRRRRPAGPGPRRGGAAGRCSPSRPAAPAPGANAIRTYRLLLDDRPRASGSSGSSCSGTRPCPARSPGCSPATTSRWSRCRARRRWTDRPFPVDRPSTTRSARRRARTTPAWLEEWRDRRRRALGARLDALLARPSPASRRTTSPARSAPPYPPGGLLFVGASNPIRDLDLMVAALRRRRAPDGARQPRPGRHRRHRLQRDRRRARPARAAPAASR